MKKIKGRKLKRLEDEKELDKSDWKKIKTFENKHILARWFIKENNQFEFRKAKGTFYTL